MKAAVEDFTPNTKVLIATGQPTLLIRWRASLPCGCVVLVGIRADDREAATSAMWCSDEHQPLIERFNEYMRASLYVVTDKPLIDVVAQMLGAANAA